MPRILSVESLESRILYSAAPAPAEAPAADEVQPAEAPSAEVSAASTAAPAAAQQVEAVAEEEAAPAEQQAVAVQEKDVVVPADGESTIPGGQNVTLLNLESDSEGSAFRAALVALHGEDLEGKDGELGRLDFGLNLLYQGYTQHLASGSDDAFGLGSSLMTFSQDRVLVDLTIDRDEMETTLASLGNIGFETTGVFQQWVSGWLPISAIPQLSALGSSVSSASGSAATSFSGLTTTQGDIAQRSDVARSNFGVDGSGITVGVLSDSFDTRAGAATTAAQDVANGDLPSGIIVLDEYDNPGSDEGRAIMQIIHDVAPGANQMFHTAFEGVASFAQGILDLDGAGADIIVDDVFYLAEPFFMDGAIAQAVDQVVANGTSYFSSAGNSADQSYESAFTSSGVAGLFGGSLHDFDPGAGVDTAQQITVPVGATVTFSFQWDQPFASVTGGVGSANDIDIYLSQTGNAANAFVGSTSTNTGGDALEIFQFTNDGSYGTTTFFVHIENYSGANPGLMKYVFFDSGGTVTVNEFHTGSGTVIGHSNAAGAAAVGAAFYGYTPAFGQSPALRESFSSVGETPILFTTSGVRLATAELRGGPDFVAPDGGNTTFFGNDIFDFNGTDPDSYGNFFGTSASAPHAAAVAALMMEQAGGVGSLTPTEVYDTLGSTAVDMDGAGYDLLSGFGLIDANAAVSAVTPTGTGNIGSGGAFLAVTNNNNDTLSIIDPVTRTVVGSASLGASSSIYGDVVASPDGTTVWTADWNPNTVSRFDISSGTPVLVAAVNVGFLVEEVAITADGKYLIAVDGGGFAPVVTIDTATNAIVDTLNLGTGFNSADVAADGSILITEPGGQVRRLLVDGSGMLTDTGESLAFGGPNNVIVAPDGNSAVVVSYSSQTFIAISTIGLNPLDSAATPGTGGVRSAVFSPAGDRIFTRSYNGTISAFSYNSGTGQIGASPLFAVTGPSMPGWYAVEQIAISADGSELYVPDGAGNDLNIYNAANGAYIDSVLGLSGPLGVASFHGVAGGDTTGLSISGNDLVITDIDGGNTDDDFTITTNGSSVTIVDNNGGTIDLGTLTGMGDGSDTVTIDLAEFTGGIVFDTLDGDDTLTIDFSTGNFGRAITFNGGDEDSINPGDQLFLQGGGTFTDATYNYTNANDGSIDITGNQTITYTGLEPITSTINATNVTLNYNSPDAEDITISDGGGSITVNSTAGELTTFVEPTTLLTINAGQGDTSTVVSAVSLAAGIEINSGDIVVDAPLTSGSGDVTLNALGPVATTTFDFDAGTQGWTVGLDATTSLGNASSGPRWTLGTSLPGTVGTSLPNTWWTNPNNGTLGAERSHVTSPVLSVLSNGTVTISFDSFSSNEGGYPTTYDVEHVQIAVNGGAFSDVHGFDPELHTNADQTFRNITFTTGALSAGDMVQVRFLYDTGDGCCGTSDITGWAFGNVEIGNAASGTGDITLNADVSAALGDVTMTATGAITQVDGTSISTTAGTISLTAENDVTLASAETGGAVEITSNGGAIVDGGDTDPDIDAATAVLDGDTGVGSDSDALETDLDNLEADGGSGGVYLTNSSALTIGGIGSMVGVSTTGGGGGGGGGLDPVSEIEPNDSVGTAQDVDGAGWNLNANADIANSTTIPHITIDGTGNNTFDYYSFTVANAGDTAVFDIDYGSGAGGSFDSYLRLYDSSGSLIASDDDSSTSQGAGGSVSSLDSYLVHTFAAAGVYVIEVARFVQNPIPSGGTYQLQISLENHALGGGGGAIEIDAASLNVIEDVTSVGGDITLTGNTAVAGSGSFTGVLVRGANVQSTSGDITISGEGGDSGSSNVGVALLKNNATATAASITTGGTVSITGTGGSAGFYAHGVRITGSSVTSTSSDAAAITIDGSGGVGGNGDYSYTGINGYYATVTATYGGVQLNGAGGVSTTGSYNAGISLLASTVSGTTLDVTGDGGAGGSFNRGIVLSSGSDLDATSGDANLTGTGGGSGSYNDGIYLEGSSADATGMLTLDGTGSTSATNFSNNHGVLVYSSTATGGTGLDIDGVGGTGSGGYNHGVNIFSSTATGGEGAVTIDGTANSGAWTSGYFNVGTTIQYSSISGTSLDIDGTGGGGTWYNRGVVTAGGTLTATDGNINIDGDSANTTSGGYNDGVYLQGTATDATGKLTITGTGSTSTTNSTGNNGVYILGGSADGDGGVEITGVGGTGSGGYNVGAYLYGVTSVNGGSNEVKISGSADGSINTAGYFNVGTNIQYSTVSGGNLDIDGVGGSGSWNNRGVMTVGSSLTATAGTIDIDGASANNTSGGYNDGVYLQSTATSASGLLTIDGTGSTSTAGNTTANNGVYLYSGSADGAAGVQITGVGGTGSGGSNYGTNINYTSIDGGSNDVTISGTADTTTAGSYNVGAGVQYAMITGNRIAVDGTGGGGGWGNRGVLMSGGSATASATSGDGIAITGDSSNNTVGGGNDGVQISGTSLTAAGSKIDIDGDGSTGVSNTSANNGVYLSGATLNSKELEITGDGGVGSGGFNYGVYFYGGSITTTGTATTQITGNGGRGAGGYNYGAYLYSATIAATNGTLDIDGTASSSTGGTTNIGVGLQYSVLSGDAVSIVGFGGSGSDYNRGIYLVGGSVSADNGDVHLGGAASVASSAGAYNEGINASGASLTSSSGHVTLDGTGGASSGNTHNNHGVYLYSVTANGSTGTTVTGTGGRGTDGSNSGVTSYYSTLGVSTSTTTITGIAHSSAGGSYNVGVSQQYSTVIGSTLNISGTGGAGADNNRGVYIVGGSAKSTGVTTIEGDTNNGTTGWYNQGVDVQNAEVGGSTSTEITGDGGGGMGFNHGIYMNAITTFGATPFTTNGTKGDGPYSEDEAGNFFP